MTQNSSSSHLVQIVLYGGFKKISSPGGGLSLVLAILQNFLKSTGGLVNNIGKSAHPIIFNKS